MNICFSLYIQIWGGWGEGKFFLLNQNIVQSVFAFHLHQRSSKVVLSPRQHCTQLQYCRPHSLFLLLGIRFFLALLWLWPCWILPLLKPKESVKIFFIPDQMRWQHLTVIWLTHLLNQMKKETIWQMLSVCLLWHPVAREECINLLIPVCLGVIYQLCQTPWNSLIETLSVSVGL